MNTMKIFPLGGMLVWVTGSSGKETEVLMEEFRCLIVILDARFVDHVYIHPIFT